MLATSVRLNRYTTVAGANYTARFRWVRAVRTRGVAVLEHGATHAYTDLVGDLVRLRLARPALYALAEQPLRHVDLHVTLVAATGSAVHFRTLAHALSYLSGAGLITRHAHSPRNVRYEITDLGRELIASLDATNRILQKHQGRERSRSSRARHEDGE